MAFIHHSTVGPWSTFYSYHNTPLISKRQEQEATLMAYSMLPVTFDEYGDQIMPEGGRVVQIYVVGIPEETDATQCFSEDIWY